MAATDQLERLLYVLAVASREGGAAFDELTQVMGVSRESIVKDLQEAIDNEYNHPAGSVEPFTITLEEDRVTVFAAKEFCRPVRLNQKEATALGLGLRVLASDASAERRAEIMELAERLEKELSISGDAPEVDVALGEDELRDVFSQAIEQKKICEIVYAKPFALPQTRRIAPARLIYGKGHWYISARDADSHDEKVYRVDRVMDAVMTDDVYSGEPAHVSTIYSADGIEAVVRYSGEVGKWIAEKDGAQMEADGSVVCVHDVADVEWLVRHVLQYAGEAVVETPELRSVVAERAERLVRPVA